MEEYLLKSMNGYDSLHEMHALRATYFSLGADYTTKLAPAEQRQLYLDRVHQLPGVMPPRYGLPQQPPQSLSQSEYQIPGLARAKDITEKLGTRYSLH